MHLIIGVIAIIIGIFVAFVALYLLVALVFVAMIGPFALLENFCMRRFNLPPMSPNLTGLAVVLIVGGYAVLFAKAMLFFGYQH